jgi:hypothetical protein
MEGLAFRAMNELFIVSAFASRSSGGNDGAAAAADPDDARGVLVVGPTLLLLAGIAPTVNNLHYVYLLRETDDENRMTHQMSGKTIIWSAATK